MTQGTSSKPQCPHCGKEISVTLWAKVMDEHRMVYAVIPKPDECMSASTIGGTLTEMDKLLKAVGRDIGVKTLPMVERIETTESGEIRFHLLITNVRPKEKQSVGGEPDPQDSALLCK